MRRFILVLFGCLLMSPALRAETRAFGSMEEAQIYQQNGSRLKGELPQQKTMDEQEWKAFLQKRLENVDISELPANERMDKMSSMSTVKEDHMDKRSFFEKVYDEAMARISTNPEASDIELKNVQYYELQTEEEPVVTIGGKAVPQISVTLPDGKKHTVPAYEHIPYLATQIEVLPSGLLKVSETFTLIADGRKVREGMVRVFKKEALSRKNKVKLLLNEVAVNGTVVPYEVAEQGKNYLIRPRQNYRLPAGVYVYNFSYVVDRYLWNYGDFYQLYWNATGSFLNLIVSNSVVSFKLPGTEPAVRKYVVTGFPGRLDGNNAVMLDGAENRIAFSNIRPLRVGEGMHVFMMLPKVDFTAPDFSKKTVWFFEEYGDIALAFALFVIAGVSCFLSWRYIRNRLKFANITPENAALSRYLWTGKKDKALIGCCLLDLFRKNAIDIQEQDNDIFLVRKNMLGKTLSVFEKKILSLLFGKKDNILQVGIKSKNKMLQVLKLVARDTEQKKQKLVLRMGGMYIFFNAAMLLCTELGMALLADNMMLFSVFLAADVLLVAGVLLWQIGWERPFVRVLWRGLAVIPAVGGFMMFVAYVHVISALLLYGAVVLMSVFVRKFMDDGALLQNAVKSVQNVRDFLRGQSGTFSENRNFLLQQSNIWALDLQRYYGRNDKVKDFYRLDIVARLIETL